MLHSTITSKGQTTIPAAIRRALGTKSGDQLAYEIGSGYVTIRVHPGIKSLQGSLGSTRGKGLSFNAIREAAAVASLGSRK